MKPTCELHVKCDDGTALVTTEYFDIDVNAKIDAYKSVGLNVSLEFKYWSKYVWPGGYPLYFITKDGGILCSECANENLALTMPDYPKYEGSTSVYGLPEWEIVEMGVNYENDDLFCDHCNSKLESAYGE